MVSMIHWFNSLTLSRKNIGRFNMFNESTDLDLIINLDRIQSRDKHTANTVSLGVEATECMICVKSDQYNLTII